MMGLSFNVVNYMHLLCQGCSSVETAETESEVGIT